MAAGLGILFRYQRTAGAAAEVRLAWPSDSMLPRPTTRPVLIQVIHPRCSCSRASLAELDRILERLQDPPQVFIVFVRPAGTPDGWERSANWERAKRIPGATLLVDAAGTEAARLGALTSGQTFLYGTGGELLFSGGITAARGETGESAGGQRLIEILEGKTPDERRSAVFGCPLHDVQEENEKP